MQRQKLEDRERLDIENQIPEVELESLDAQTFWTDHISARKPAILRHASDTVIHTPESWTLDFLDGKAVSRYSEAHASVDIVQPLETVRCAPSSVAEVWLLYTLVIQSTSVYLDSLLNYRMLQDWSTLCCSRWAVKLWNLLICSIEGCSTIKRSLEATRREMRRLSSLYLCSRFYYESLEICDTEILWRLFSR